ncbi:GGDEF domain-containing protein [Fulvimarina sp. MAC8]|uniref:GGDEF domain-containing protein n=1 Tax=Fulvimarina sp. MAC8 TaxID=3162874 RepID=UPI0032EA9569
MSDVEIDYRSGLRGSVSENESIFDSIDAFRRTVLLGLLLFTAGFGAAFSVLNYLNENFSAMAAELAMGSLAIGLIPIVRKTDHLVTWSIVYLIPFNSVMMFIISTPQSSPSVFAWVLLIPILSHMLIGRALGGAMTLTFMLIAFSLYYTRFGDDLVNGNSRALLNVAGVALCIFGFSYAYETSRSRAENALKKRAFTDALTGLGNRSYLYCRFGEEIERNRRYGTPCGILLLDIDFFKRINDTYGHEVGDNALQLMSAILTENIRTNDDAFRHGGEEFCVLLHDTAHDDAACAAEKLRRIVEAAELKSNGSTINFTTSIGVASIPDDGEDLQELMNVADMRLYDAKSRGRNQVVSA